jgi:hypothetical protein
MFRGVKRIMLFFEWIQLFLEHRFSHRVYTNGIGYIGKDVQ